jgi:hypothetical protein
VKCSTSVQGRTYHINSLDQLMPPDQGSLVFFGARVREAGGAPNTLVSVVCRARELLAAAAAALTRWESTLARAGYSPAHDEEYARVRLRLVDETLYAVRDEFPRVTSTSLALGVPPGVTGVRYNVNLDGFSHFALTQPAEIAQALA